MNVVKIPPKSTPVHQRKLARRALIITGRNLAHGSRGARERAMLAAAWINGELTIVRPTIALATAVFGVSKPTVDAALDIDRDQFVRAHADEIFASLDRLTKTA